MRLFLKISFFISFILLLPTLVHAETYYLRPNGGTITQCTGKTDVDYPGTGSNQSCAFNNPFWVVGVNEGSSPLLAGGDTVYVKGGSYKIGYGAGITTGGCGSTSWTENCTMQAIPSGPDAAHPTRILGEGWDTGCASPPEWWGTEKTSKILNLNATSNAEVKCLEITDHAPCGYAGSNLGTYVFPSASCSGAYPHGEYGQIGIFAADSANVLLQDINVHGMAVTGIWAARLTDWTFRRVRLYSNGNAGWDGDLAGAGVGANNLNHGTLLFDHFVVQYSGCTETYPGKQPANCIGQNDGGYAYGDGVGLGLTGANFIFIDSDISFNTQDGLDMLYHRNEGDVTIIRSRFEGNAGSDMKINIQGEDGTGGVLTIENVVSLGSCDYYSATGLGAALRAPGAQFNNCRAGGNNMSLALANGGKVHIKNSTFTSRAFSHILASAVYSQVCNGNEEITVQNSLFFGNPSDAPYTSGKVIWFYNGGNDGNGSGNCGGGGAYPFEDKLSVDHTLVFNVDDYSGYIYCPAGTGNLCVNPNLVGAPLDGNVTDVNLTVSSPGIGNADATLTGISNLGIDYNSFSRGTSWDIGGLQYGSAPTECTADAGACTTGSTCCGGYCCSSLCSSSACAGASCTGQTISNCDVRTTTDGGTSGACLSGYIGSCSFSCSNGTWSSVSNTCAAVASGTNVWRGTFRGTMRGL